MSVEPVNLGSSRAGHRSISWSTIVEEIAGVTLERRYKLDAPQGVRGRNSDNEMIRTQLGWEPSISLRSGLERTYSWVHDQVAARDRAALPMA